MSNPKYSMQLMSLSTAAEKLLAASGSVQGADLSMRVSATAGRLLAEIDKLLAGEQLVGGNVGDAAIDGQPLSASFGSGVAPDAWARSVADSVAAESLASDEAGGGDSMCGNCEAKEVCGRESGATPGPARAPLLLEGETVAIELPELFGRVRITSPSLSASDLARVLMKHHGRRIGDDVRDAIAADLASLLRPSVTVEQI